LQRQASDVIARFHLEIYLEILFHLPQNTPVIATFRARIPRMRDPFFPVSISDHRSARP